MVKRSEQQGNNEVLSESVSALVDGEFNDFDFQRVLRDAESAELRNQWRRFHLMGAVARNELDEHSLIDISGSVWEALESEESYSATDSVSSSQPERKTPSRKWHFLVNGVGKSAIAASVAAAVLVGVQYMPGEGTPASEVAAVPDVPGPVKSAEMLPAGFEPPRLNARFVSTNPSSSHKAAMPDYRSVPVAIPVSEGVHVNDPEMQAYLNQLLMIHAEQSSQAGVLGVLPYARVLYPDVESDK